MAGRLFTKGKNDAGKDIVSREIKPLIHSLKSSDRGEWIRSVTDSAPVLYRSQPLLALEMFHELPDDWIDFAIKNVIQFLFRNTVVDDPYEGADHQYPLNAETAEEICKLLSHIKADFPILNHVESLIESMLWSRNKHKLTIDQRKDIGRRISDIIHKQLPAKLYIQHDGYKIACEILVEKLDKKSPRWEALIDKVRLIPNKADIAVVLSMVCEHAENLSLARRLELIDEVRKRIEALPSKLDRADRLSLLATSCEKVNPSLCKDLLREAFSITGQNPSGEMRGIQKRIIDTAYEINKDLASTLVSSLDDDDARQFAKNKARIQLQRKQLRSNLLDPHKSAVTVLEAENIEQILPSAAWSSLGSLNAGRAEAQDFKNMREYIRRASQMPLSESFALFAWGIETFGKKAELAATGRRSESDMLSTATVVRGAFDATLLGSDLIAKVVLTRSDAFNSVRRMRASGFHERTSIVQAGERIRALHMIEDWIQQKAKKQLKITDPYIGPEEAALILQIVQAQNPDLEVSILTSDAHQKAVSTGILKSAYIREWKKISDQDPPFSLIVVAGVKGTSGSPIHDRWLLSDGVGLRLGTSFNSLGVTSDSEISHLTASEVATNTFLLDGYLSQTTRDFRGARILYDSFSLG